MLNRYLVLSLLVLCSSAQASTKGVTTVQAGKTAEHLVSLRAIAEQINRVNPLGQYMVTVPRFLALTSEDIHAFLAGIPYEAETQKKGTKHALSMLGHLQQLWRDLHASLKDIKDNKLTPQSQELLEQIRQSIDDAFKHDVKYNSKTALAEFAQRAINNNTSLIVRDSLQVDPIASIKSAYPVKASELNRAIALVLKSYYYAETIEQLLKKGRLPEHLYMAVTLQTFVSTEDQNRPIISGMSCSYDITTGYPGIITIESIQHHGKSLKDPNIACDRYYVHDTMIYPIIAKKQSCFMPDFAMSMIHTQNNNPSMQNCSSLDRETIEKLAQATQLIAEEYKQPICISFIKHDKTIYLIQIHIPQIQKGDDPTYIDPLYAHKAKKENALTVRPIKPKTELIIINRPKQILFAPDLKHMLQALEQHASDDIQVGFIEKMPSEWSKEVQLLETINRPIVFVQDVAPIKTWLREKKLPLVIDPQHKIMFPFKRRKGFCTLFQVVTHGLKEHPTEQHISIMDSFIKPITEWEREIIEPKEFFSGVTINQLFDLIKQETNEIATKALRSLLFRLQNHIKRYEITQKERAEAQEPVDAHTGDILHKLYSYIERVAYQVYKTLDGDPKDCQKKLIRLFLSDMLQNITLQTPNDHVINSFSFHNPGA